MDNPDPGSRDEAVLTCSPRPGELAVSAAGGVLLAVVALVAVAEPAGRVLVGLAAVGLLGLAAVGALRRPRLHADAEGLVVRGPLRTVALAWVDVGDVLLRQHRRLGREVGMLEVSGAGDSEVLLVLGRRDLGVDPREVHPELSRRHLAALARRRA
ncbi:hypothetical protein GCM10027047_05640 [Rhodococcus aerolatus]